MLGNNEAVTCRIKENDLIKSTLYPRNIREKFGLSDIPEHLKAQWAVLINRQNRRHKYEIGI